MGRKRKWIPRSQRLASEINFLAAFYDASSPTHNDGRASAIEAGYAEATASRVAENLLMKYREFDFKAIAQAMGIDRIKLGLAFQKIINEGVPRDVLNAARLLLSNMGEMTDAAGTQKNVNVNMPTMVIVGETEERVRRLKSGGKVAPQLPPAPAEDVLEAEVVSEEESTPEKNARRLTAEDFSGTNLTEAKKPKGPSY
jgi:hypothetical protein